MGGVGGGWRWSDLTSTVGLSVKRGNPGKNRGANCYCYRNDPSKLLQEPVGALTFDLHPDLDVTFVGLSSVSEDMLTRTC